MRHAPLVSVIIPAYRRAEYASQAARCAASQTLLDVEVIVVDDASGDETVACYNLPEEARLVTLAQRSGPSAARNAGIREARGQYIAFLDQDDLWLRDKLEAQVSLLDCDPAAAMTYCHVRYVYEDLSPAPEQVPFRPVTGADFGDVASHWFAKTCSAVMVRRESLERAGPMAEDLWIAGDWDLWTRLSLLGPLLPDPEPRVLYRTYPEQLTGRGIRGREDAIVFHTRWLAWAQRERPESKGKIRRALVRDLQRYADVLLWTEGRPLGAAQALARAIRLNPRDLRSYVRLLRLATAPMHPRFRRGGHP